MIGEGSPSGFDLIPNHFFVISSCLSQGGFSSRKFVSFSKKFFSGLVLYSSVEPMISLLFDMGIIFLPFILNCFGSDNKLIYESFTLISIA